MYSTICYGAGKGNIKEDDAIDVLRKRNDLWNKLVDIEYSYREKLDQLVASFDSGVETRTQILRRDDVREEVLELTRQRRSNVNEACRNSNLYWANYTDVTKSYESARKRNKLKHHEFNGSGKLSVHYQNGIDSWDVFSEEERKFQIDFVPTDVFSLPRRERKKLTQTSARIRIGTAGKSPIWFEIPIVLHRPMENGIIKDVAFVREVIGNDHRWHVSITMEIGPMPSRYDESVGIMSTGWKVIPEGILVASCDNESLILPDDWISEFKKCEDIHDIKYENPDKYEHLNQYESHLVDQLIKRRRELYRIFASKICKRFSRLIVDYVNLEWMKNKNSGASWNMNAVGLNYFYDILKNAASKNGTIIVKSKSGEIVNGN